MPTAMPVLFETCADIEALPATTSALVGKAAPPAKRAPGKPPRPREGSRGGKPGAADAAKRGGGRKKR